MDVIWDFIEDAFIVEDPSIENVFKEIIRRYGVMREDILYVEEWAISQVAPNKWLVIVPKEGSDIVWCYEVAKILKNPTFVAIIYHGKTLRIVRKSVH